MNGIGYGITPFMGSHGILARSSGGGAVDPDAQAFITSASITDPTQQSAINQLVVDLKGYSIWSKMKALYPFVGGTSTTHKYNLKDPRDLDVAFRLVFNGGWTHSSNGATPNGTNGYANTYFNPTTQSLSTTSQHLSYYSRTNANENAVEIGVISGANNNFLGLYVSSTVGTRASLASSGRYNNTSAPIDTRGLFTTSRINGTDIKVYVNNTTQATQAIASTGNDNFNMYIGTYGASSGQTLWSSKQCAFASIGDGLNDTEVANFYTAVQAFQTTLGRSIGTQTVSDADAQGFVTNAGIVDQVEANAVNNLVIGLKADSLWTKMKAIYPFVGGTATTHKYNLVNPLDTDAAFRLVFNGGWTHSSTGALPNGNNGWAETFVKTGTDLALNSTHVSVYSRTDAPAVSRLAIGNCWGAATFELSMWLKTASSNANHRNNTSSISQVSNLDSRGFYIGNRNSSTQQKIIKNTTINTFNVNSIATTNSFTINISSALQYTGTGLRSYYDNKELAFSSIGDGLTDTEAANFYTLVQNFNTALARQV